MRHVCGCIPNGARVIDRRCDIGAYETTLGVYMPVLLR
jgi:hypothetical protein